jgi:hypothetical protein
VAAVLGSPAAVGTDVVPASGVEVGDAAQRQAARPSQQAPRQQEVRVVPRILTPARGPVKVLQQGEMTVLGDDGWDLGYDTTGGGLQLKAQPAQ